MNKTGNQVMIEIKEEKQNVHHIRFSHERDLYLVGTAHVSRQSVELVEEIINEIEPDTICVELDDQRYKSLMKKQNYEDMDIIRIIREKQLFFFIGQFIMASYQKKIATKTGSRPGMEFKKAIEMGEEKGIRMIMADRNIGVTLKRAFRLTPFWHKMKFLASLFVADEEDIEELDIEKLKEHDAIERIVENFEEELPVTKEVLIDERDRYLASKIHENLGKVTVAVVGAGHVPGMLREFSSPLTEEERDDIDFIPPPGRISRILPWIIPALVLGLFIWGFSSGRKEVAGDAIIYWVLANGVLTSIGCLIAMAHPLTVLSGFIAAPFTSLNPTIGAGFVTAIVQTFVNKPRISDFEDMQNSHFSIRLLWKNRLTRIFLVFILSSIGSSVGTFVALGPLYRLFSQ